MRNSILRGTRYVLLPLVVAFCSQLPLRAASIVYSWAGTIELAPDAVDDPWSIGPEGKPLYAEFVVDANAQNLITNSSNWMAYFEYRSARISIDGHQVASNWPSDSPMPKGIMMFDNFLLDGPDRIGTYLMLTLDNHEGFVDLGVNLPDGTYTFQEGITPPVFETVTLPRATYVVFAGQNYIFSAQHPASISATLVPEPQSCVAFATMLLFVSSRFCESRFRLASPASECA